MTTYYNNYAGFATAYIYNNFIDIDLKNRIKPLSISIYEHIKNKYYDIVIYGSYHRGMPYYDLVCEKYNPNEIILLCGEDIHCCNYNDFSNKGHHVFVRELY